jgi:tetratricopeptide (TPR) repeat protein
MRVHLPSALLRAGLVAVVVSFSGLYLYLVQRDYRASRWAESAHLEGLQRAATLQSRSAEIYHRIGRFQLFAVQDPRAARAALERAANLNPHVSWYWLDLATAHHIAGNQDAYQTALLRASAADPKTPVVAWEIANLKLVEGDTEAALPLFRTVVENDPDSAERALELCWRATGDVDRVLARAVPPSVDAHLAFVDVLASRGLDAAAWKVWTSMTALRRPIAPARAMPFVAFLLQQRRLAEAQQAMQLLADAQPALQPTAFDGGISIVNPGFEEEYIQGPLSWTLQESRAVDLQIDGGEFRTGTRSLMLNFNGPGFRLSGVTQYIRVPADSIVETSIHVKAKQIIGAEGPHIVFQDAYTHQVLARGQEWVGSNAWREERLAFHTGSSELVAFRIARDSAEGGLRGTLWIDDLKVVKR